MSFLKKDPPTACPKCGKADSWRCVIDDTPLNNAANAGMGNDFYLDIQRDPLYVRQDEPGKTIRYCCDNCGYEKTYRD